MKHVILSFGLAFLVALTSCHKAVVETVSTEMLPVDASLDAVKDSAYLVELKDISAQLDSALNVVIGASSQPLTVHQPECPMLNWASDALLDEARKLYDGHVDVAIVNIGSMRCEWQAGNITPRNVYELMPFDNELVVLTMMGEDLLELCQIFAMDGGQGVAGLRMVAEDKQLAEATIDGKPIMPEAYYHVATSDYLAGGTDHMTPFLNAVETWHAEQKIRDLYIDWVREHHDVPAVVDGRMQIIN